MNTHMQEIALGWQVINPFAELAQAISRLGAWLFAADDEDKTSKNEDQFEDDLEDSFGDDEEDENGEKKQKDDTEGDDGEDDDEKDEKKSSKKKSSAVVQKQKYREKLKIALDKIKELEGKKDSQGQLTEEQKKEQQAEKFLAEKIKGVLKELDSEKSQKEIESEEKLQDELDEVLEENTDLTEKQILDVCEDLEVSPRQAAKVIKREMKLKGKTKPNLPQPKRGSTEVQDDDKKPTKKVTLDSINRSIKEKIRKGLL